MTIRNWASRKRRVPSAKRRLLELARKTAVLQNLGESIRFQKTEIEKLKHDILGDDRKSRTRYIQEFVEEFRNFESACSMDDLYRRISETRLVLVGDFHALPASQEFAAHFIETLASRGAQLCLGVEMLYGRNQNALQDWIAGRITEGAFLHRIRYDMEWGYDWASFKRVFTVARQHHIPIFGIDCDPRTDMRLIHRRDACVASKLISLLRHNPDRQIVALFGESHLASGHLPKRIKELGQQTDLQVQPLVVLQNIDEIYWKLMRQSLEHEAVVKIHDNAYCVFNTTPFEKYEAYRQTLEKWRAEQAGDGGEIYLTSTVYNLINTLLDFIKVDKFSYCLRQEETCIEFMVDGYPEVYTHEELGEFKKLLRGAQVPRSHISRILEHAARDGSCYVPPINAIFIGQFDLVHGAEEAAHFVNFACKDQRSGKYRGSGLSAPERFYTTVMEEALAYFGSKIIAPSRDQGLESPFLGPRAIGQNGNVLPFHANGHGSATPVRLEDLGLSGRDYEFIRRFLLAHAHLETNYAKMNRVPSIIGAGIRSRGRKWQWIVHELGYALGEKLHRAYLEGRVSRKEISSLFFARFENTGEALSTYLDLVARCAA